MAGFPVPGAEYRYDAGDLEPLPYRPVPLDKKWNEYDITHPLTDAGQKKFAEDWTSLIAEKSISN